CPGKKSCTLEPTSTISPTNSCPTAIGTGIVRCAQASHFQMCRSVPQMPVLWTRISTSLMPIVGRSISSSQRPGSGRDSTRAFLMGDGAGGSGAARRDLWGLPRDGAARFTSSSIPDVGAEYRTLPVQYATQISRMTDHRNAPDEAVGSHLCRRVRALRKERAWSLEQLAAASGVSRSMLSQIERNEANPTLAVTFRIAQAFGMTVGELLEAPGAQSSIQVIRSTDRAHMFRSDPDCQIRTLSPLNLEKDVEFYEIRLAPGGALRSAAHFAGTREYL